jgi:hypothetical protein
MWAAEAALTRRKTKMKRAQFQNLLLTAAFCLTPLMAAAGGIPGPNPHPNPTPDPADVQAVWAGNNVALGTENPLQALVTVADSATGLPVTNLSKGNFTATFALVNALCSAPIIKTVSSSVPGVYLVTFGFDPNTTVCTWKVAQYPVALQVYSIGNPFLINSPGSYQGQVATLLTIH